MVMPMPAKIAHLEMIQGVVNRLAHSSALLKGWSALLAFLPAVVFWGLDGYYLWQERLFRNLYKHVRGLADNDIDFSMDVTKAPGAKKKGLIYLKPDRAIPI